MDLHQSGDQPLLLRQPVGDWILIRSCTRVGAGGAGLTTATLSDRQGPFAEVMQAMSFERREAQAQVFWAAAA
jgi:acyl-Coa thioesterase superfamily protein